MKNTLAVIGVTLLLATSMSAGLLAHSGAKGIVKERMDAMKEIGKGMKALGAMAKGQAQLRESAIKAAARTISEHSARIGELFPDTPKSRKGHMTEAAPAIWENNADFLALAKQMAKNANDLNLAAASLDRAGLGKFVGKLAADCKSCHQKFRIKKN